MLFNTDKILKRTFKYFLVSFIVVGLALISVTTTSCTKKDDKGAADKGKQTVKKASNVNKPDVKAGDKMKTLDKLVAVVEEEPLEYYNRFHEDGRLKRSPFEPIDIAPKGHLGEFDISLMRCNGVILGGPSGSVMDKANIWTPAGKTSIVHIGDPIGIHDGRIINITKDGVTVRENWLDEKDAMEVVDRIIDVEAAGKKAK